MPEQMKAFAVEVTTIAIVMAKDSAHAAVVAQENKRVIYEDYPSPRITVGIQIKRAEDAGHGWTGKCVPYGGDGNTLLEKLLGQPA